MKLRFLIVASGAKKHISIFDTTGRPCRLVSSVFCRDRYHPRFAKRRYYAHILSPLLSTPDVERILLEIWRRMKSAVPGEVELGGGFTVLWQDNLPANISEPTLSAQAGGIHVPQACSCGNYVARSTSGVIDLTCSNCQKVAPQQIIGQGYGYGVYYS